MRRTPSQNLLPFGDKNHDIDVGMGEQLVASIAPERENRNPLTVGRGEKRMRFSQCPVHGLRHGGAEGDAVAVGTESPDVLVARSVQMRLERCRSFVSRRHG